MKSILGDIMYFFAGNNLKLDVKFTFKAFTKIKINSINQNSEVEITIKARANEHKSDLNYCKFIDSFFVYNQQRYPLNISGYLKTDQVTLDNFIESPVNE